MTDFIDVGELHEVRRCQEPSQLADQCCRRRGLRVGAVDADQRQALRKALDLELQ